MTYTPKQRELMGMWQDGKLQRLNLLEGSVSSGKTWISLVLWAFWIATMPQDKLYLMCAKSLTTLKRNCLILLQEMVGDRNFTFSVPAKEGYLFGRRVLLEGANDARAESKIRGLTLQGAYCDELTQFQEDFFAMLLSRLRLPGAKLIATTNPDSPGHWLKKNYIDRADELDFLDIKFTIEDNTTLPSEYVENIKREYMGVYYDRFILGEWVLAQGVVYPMFSRETNVTDEHGEAGEWYLSMDYGTMNPTAMELWRIENGFATLEYEYYHDGRKERKQKTDEDYYSDLEAFVGDIPIRRIIIDPSAASMKTTIRKHGKFHTLDADNSVLDGIRWTGTLIGQGKIKIHSSCVHTLEEFGMYRWDESKTEDAVVKENDHAMDAMRYLCQTMKRKFRENRNPTMYGRPA